MPSALDNLWTEAIKEAYTVAPASDVILHTLELRHSTFLPTAVRVVLDHGVLLVPGDPDIYGHSLKLEASAPLNPGTFQNFVACMFDFALPRQHEGDTPAIEISIDNVAELISEKLDAAVALAEPIAVTYREYLLSDKTTPQFILGGLILQRVRSNLSRVTGTAVFVDVFNKSFPAKVYRPADFQTLSQ